MIVDILEISATEVGGASLTLQQCANRAFGTVGASVQAALLGGNGTPSEADIVKVKGAKAAMDELVALGNHGQVFAVFCTLTEVQAMVSSGNVPNS